MKTDESMMIFVVSIGIIISDQSEMTSDIIEIKLTKLTMMTNDEAIIGNWRRVMSVFSIIEVTRRW